MDMNNTFQLRKTGVFPFTIQPQANKFAKTKRGTIFFQGSSGRMETMQLSPGRGSSISERLLV